MLSGVQRNPLLQVCYWKYDVSLQLYPAGLGHYLDILVTSAAETNQDYVVRRELRREF